MDETITYEFANQTLVLVHKLTYSAFTYISLLKDLFEK